MTKTVTTTKVFLSVEREEVFSPNEQRPNSENFRVVTLRPDKVNSFMFAESIAAKRAATAGKKHHNTPVSSQDKQIPAIPELNLNEQKEDGNKASCFGCFFKK